MFCEFSQSAKYLSKKGSRKFSSRVSELLFCNNFKPNLQNLYVGYHLEVESK